MKKRVISVALMAALICTMPLSVSAQGKTTEITASVESEYTLTIPADTDITFNATSTNLNGTLKVTGNVLPTQSVSVSAQTSSLYNSAQGTSLPYKLMNGNTEYQTVTWSAAELQSAAPKEIQLSIAITEDDWKAAKAGDYAGNIVFTATMNTTR